MTDHGPNTSDSGKIDYGEPWDIRITNRERDGVVDPDKFDSVGHSFHLGIYSESRDLFPAGCDEYMVFQSTADLKRIVACVNACAGMIDPEAEIAYLLTKVEE